jgi:hypothetical protein
LGVEDTNRWWSFKPSTHWTETRNCCIKPRWEVVV